WENLAAVWALGLAPDMFVGHLQRMGALGAFETDSHLQPRINPIPSKAWQENGSPCYTYTSSKTFFFKNILPGK
ncbi:MAG: hypothetical protein KAT11_06355, partial [Phycisphaerae bacterium]|nr:hypothetical protein [Phycisphaerae bacterium]